MPAVYNALTSGDFVVGKPVTFEEFQAVIDNPTAIAEGASGAPRVVVPTALSTTETNQAKVLKPDGAGGVAWGTVDLPWVYTSGSGNWTPPLTGTVLVEMWGGGGGGAGGTTGCGGGGGQRIVQTLAVTAGVNVAYAVGAGGAGGASGANGNLGTDTTFGSLTAAGGGNGQSSGTFGAQVADPPPAGKVGGRNGTITNGAAGNYPGAGGNSHTSTSSGGAGATGILVIRYVT